MDKNFSGAEGTREGIVAAIKMEAERRKKEPRLLLYDTAAFLLSLVFSRFHLLFGSYPLALSFIAVTPKRVWITLFGAIVGSLSRGRFGVIHAMICIIVVFLRIIISGGDKKENRAALFSEAPLVQGADLLKEDDRIPREPGPGRGVDLNMGRQFVFAHAAGDRRGDHGGTVAIADIVLYDQYRAQPALLTADDRG